jgi:DNA-binding beta-propeller fold protein YncE
MLGATYAGQAWQSFQKTPVKIDDPRSPLTVAFAGKGFTVADDIHMFREPGLREAVHVLLSVNTAEAPKSMWADRPDGDYPLSWIKKHGEGRVFYTALGHEPDMYLDPAFLAHLLAGVQFAAGDLPADTSPGKALPAKAAETMAGWTALFDGKDLSAFEADEEQKKHWLVSDSLLRYDGRAPTLWTKESFGDFQFRVDWRMPRAGDSGVFLRGFRGTHRGQLNIWSSDAGSGQLWNYKVDPKENADKPVGEWNTFLVTMKGDRLTLEVNGREVFTEQQLKGIPASGPIGLQQHGAPIEWKNIYVKKLPADAGKVVGGLAALPAPAAEPPTPGPSGAKPDAGLRRYIYSLHPDGSQEGYNCNGPASGMRGIAVLDIDQGCAFVRCIPLPCLEGKTGGHGGRGITGHTATKRIFYSFMLSNEKTAQLNANAGPKPIGNHPVVGCLDVATDRVIWERYLYEFPEAKGRKLGAGQAAITPDGRKLYVPPEWTGGNETTVLDASNGNWIAFVPTGGNGCGNAVMSPDGAFVYASRGWVKIRTATDTIEKVASSGKLMGFPVRSSHYMIDATGDRMYVTCVHHDGIKGYDGSPAVICSTSTGEVLAVPRVPNAPPLHYFMGPLSHEGSFTPCGRRFWTQAMEGYLKADLPPGLFQHPQVVDNPGPGSIKWVSQWDITTDPPSLVRMIATRSPGHSHAHALVTREGDLLLTGNGYALDTATGKVKHTWQHPEGKGKWFQGTKFMQVNCRDGQVDWVGQRHGTGWLYHVPALSEMPERNPTANGKESKP